MALKKSLDPEKVFYNELDQSKTKGGRCGCVSLIVLFAILLIGLEAALFLALKAIKAKPIASGNLSSSATLREGQDVSKQNLENGRFQVAVSQGVLCARLKVEPGLQDVSCSISEQGIEISGKIGVLPQNTRVVLTPKVEEEKLVIELRSVHIGSFRVPNLTKGLSGQVTRVILNGAPDLDKASIDKVEAGEGVLIIEATKNE